MPQRETQVTIGDKVVPGIEVPVSESTEKWSEFTLEDGTIIRAKVSIVSVVRVIDQYDQTGNPIYTINAVPIIGVAHTPQALRKQG
jgi:hypothetical protein